MKERLEQMWEVLKWHVEAWSTGASFADVSSRRRLIYRVEQLFLIHRATDHWLLHIAADPEADGDETGSAATRQAVQDFVRDHFWIGNKSGTEEFSLGETRVCIALGPQAYLAAVIHGRTPRELRERLQEMIDQLHLEHGSELANFNGDPAAFGAAAPTLADCLCSEYKPAPEIPKLKYAGRWLGALAAVVLVASLLSLRSHHRWNDFLARLKAEPGILVAATERNWLAPSRVVGLRDPLARNPAAIAKEAKLNPARVRFVWKEYAASDPELVQRRLGGDGTSTPLEQFTAVFQPPPSLQAVVRNSTLVLSGTAPYEWVEPVRAGATKIPGITAINGDGLVVEFDPKLVRQRFRDEFGLPERVDANLRNGRLILTGEATHAWLDRVRRGALRIAGVQVLDDRLVVDIDQRAFHEARLVIEDASVLFVLNRDSVSPDAALAEIAEAARRCFAAASSMGVNVVLELRGYGDAVGTEAENAELSRRRAEAVRVSLVEKGLEEQKLISLGLGTPPPPGPGEKPGAGKFDRRVFFRIVIQP